MLCILRGWPIFTAAPAPEEAPQFHYAPVPALPLSREQYRLEVLRKSLAVYRMVFGQIRQDDLIAFLLARFPENDIASIAKELRIDLTPPKPASAEPVGGKPEDGLPSA